MPSCPRCGADAAETARFCSACGAPLGGGQGRTVHARKIVTVMFADVERFTALSERIDPESLQQVMSRFIAEMRRIIVRHGGTIEKLMGDAIMAGVGGAGSPEGDAQPPAPRAPPMRGGPRGPEDGLQARGGGRP